LEHGTKKKARKQYLHEFCMTSAASSGNFTGAIAGLKACSTPHGDCDVQQTMVRRGIPSKLKWDAWLDNAFSSLSVASNILGFSEGSIEWLKHTACAWLREFLVWMTSWKAVFPPGTCT
jgi:hypothetical protein